MAHAHHHGHHHHPQLDRERGRHGLTMEREGAERALLQIRRGDAAAG